MRAANQYGPRPWITFFFGSPRRFIFTVFGALFLFILIFPGIGWELVGRLLERLTYAFGPVVSMLIPFAIVGWGFWIMLGMPGRTKKKKEKH